LGLVGNLSGEGKPQKVSEGRASMEKPEKLIKKRGQGGIERNLFRILVGTKLGESDHHKQRRGREVGVVDKKGGWGEELGWEGRSPQLVGPTQGSEGETSARPKKGALRKYAGSKFGKNPFHAERRQKRGDEKGKKGSRRKAVGQPKKGPTLKRERGAHPGRGKL